MAHGSPRINICYDCNRYILVNRFSKNPICPNCGKESEQTNEREIKEKYKLGIFYEFILSFTKWTII